MIVNVIIRDMLWDPEATYGGTHVRTMISLEDFLDDTESLKEIKVVDKLCIVINNPVYLSLVTDYLWVGVSFRLVACVIMATKERTRIFAIGSCSDYMIAKYD